ncbi:MAG: hypothetical protein IKJ33_01955 [Clostridia bacterium]|nr:hypothetical protein [Clostridia bacterium]
MNNKKIYDFLIKILLKKAEGYYYTEEQEEYEKTQNKSQNSKIKYENISLFENFDTSNNKTTLRDDIINSTNEKLKQEQNNKNLVMVKKKITKHYIPPDMFAIKILFETIKETVGDDNLKNISNEELLKLKDKLIGELLNENK